MTLNLQQEQKERLVRKTAYMSNEAVIRAFSLRYPESSKNCTIREIPNKYSTKVIPKVDIEQVISKHLLRSETSPTNPTLLSPRITSMALRPRSGSQKSFYYNQTNEILSVDEFFQVYKDVQGHRKKQDKIKYVRAIEEQRAKVENAATERAISTARTPFTGYSLNVSNIMAGSQTPLTRRAPEHPLSLTVRKSSLKDSQVAQSTARVSPEIPSNILENEIIKEKLKETTENSITVKSPVRFNLELNNIQSVQSPTNLRVRSSSTSARGGGGFTSAQKFTQKEIVKHLIRATVSPKPERRSARGIQKEQAILAMFKDSQVMDYQVEGSIRRARRCIEGLEGEESSRPQSSRPQSSRVRASSIGNKTDLTLKTTKSVKIRPMSSKSISSKLPIDVNFHLALNCLDSKVEGNGVEIGKNIQESINNISHALGTTTGRLLSGINRLNEKKEKPKKTIGRVPLRSEIGAKYNIIQLFNEHKELSQKIRDVRKKLRKEEVSPSYVSNQVYLNFYH